MLFLFLLDLYRRALGTKSEAESGVGPGALWSPKGGATTAVDSAVVSVAPGDATLWLPATVLAEVVCSAQAGIFCQVAVLASMTAYTAHAASVCASHGISMLEMTRWPGVPTGPGACDGAVFRGVKGRERDTFTPVPLGNLAIVRMMIP